MGPGVAPVGTTATISSAEWTVNVAAAPLNVTDFTSKKLVPEIVTGVPTGPSVGINERILGSTVKALVLMITPPGVLIAIKPVRVSATMVAVMVFEDATSKG